MEGYNIEEIDILGYKSTKTFRSSTPSSISPKSYITIYKNNNILVTIDSLFRNLFIKTFLPINYETSVRPEYLKYQYYDTIQGLCSYIRGVITIRAVLVGAGVGEVNKSATTASIAWAFSDGIGMIGSLLLAYTSSKSFEIYVKEWRLLADVLNNFALTVDLFNHFLHFFTKNEYHYAILLAISSLFKCSCGLIAGATKARISSHFALKDSLADVSAKESTQETAIALIGLFLGSIITKIIGDSDFDNVFIFFVLTMIHFWANYRLTRTLVFDTLNPQRCYLITKSMIKNRNVYVSPPSDVTKSETLLLPIYLAFRGPRLGVSIGEILNTLDFIKDTNTTVATSSNYKSTSFNNLINAFKDEHFVIGVDKNERIVICISNTANNDDNVLLRAFMMGCFIHQTWLNQRKRSKEEKSNKIRLSNLYYYLINFDSKRSLNWFNHIVASSSKGGTANKPSSTLLAGWNVSENKTKLGDDSFRYKNKLLRSSTKSPDSSSNIKGKSRVSFSINTKDVKINESLSSDLGDYSIKETEKNVAENQTADITDLLLTYTGTNLVLDLFSGGSVTDSPQRVDQTTTNNDERQEVVLEENVSDSLKQRFSKGESLR